MNKASGTKRSCANAAFEAELAKRVALTVAKVEQQTVKKQRLVKPNVNDVLCGQYRLHRGNVQFQDIVNSKKTLYLAASTKFEKSQILTSIVNKIRSMNPPGRFLKEEKGMWYREFVKLS